MPMPMPGLADYPIVGRQNKGIMTEVDIRKPKTKTKKPPLGGYDITAYCFDFIRYSLWCPGRDLNPHSHTAEGF